MNDPKPLHLGSVRTADAVNDHGKATEISYPPGGHTVQRTWVPRHLPAQWKTGNPALQPSKNGKVVEIPGGIPSGVMEVPRRRANGGTFSCHSQIKGDLPNAGPSGWHVGYINEVSLDFLRGKEISVPQVVWVLDRIP